MIKISTIILTGNKEDLLEGCLKSINWTDEIILIETVKKEEVRLLANKYNCKIIKASKTYDFSIWRNQGSKTALGEWLLYIDSDERLTSALSREIQSVINDQKLTYSAYFLPRKNFYWGKEFKSCWPDYQLRLMKKKKLLGWQGNLHELPKVEGKIGKLTAPLFHLTHRTIDECLENTLKWSWLEAKNRFEHKHPPMTGLRFLRIVFSGFWQEFINKRIWREGTEGVIEGIYQIFSLFITYVRLWQLQRKQKYL